MLSENGYHFLEVEERKMHSRSVPETLSLFRVAVDRNENVSWDGGSIKVRLRFFGRKPRSHISLSYGSFLLKIQTKTKCHHVAKYIE